MGVRYKVYSMDMVPQNLYFWLFDKEVQSPYLFTSDVHGDTRPT